AAGVDGERGADLDPSLDEGYHRSLTRLGIRHRGSCARKADGRSYNLWQYRVPGRIRSDLCRSGRLCANGHSGRERRPLLAIAARAYIAGMGCVDPSAGLHEGRRLRGLSHAVGLSRVITTPTPIATAPRSGPPSRE